MNSNLQGNFLGSTDKQHNKHEKVNKSDRLRPSGSNGTDCIIKCSYIDANLTSKLLKLRCASARVGRTKFAISESERLHGEIIPGKTVSVTRTTRPCDVL